MSVLAIVGLVGAICLGAGLILSVVFGVVFFFLRRRKKSVESAVRSHLGDHRIELIDPKANSYGLSSKGVLQIRGNGCLALTDSELFFRQWKPERDISIPRDEILRVEQVRTHNAKRSPMPMVKVHFRNEQGREDSIAWIVQSIQPWMQALA